MNPPYSRAASDWDHKGRHVKQYRGLGTTRKEQQLMSARQSKLLRGTCFDGYAGLGTGFFALADKLVKDGGTLAFVLPVSLATGYAWRKLRALVESNYRDLTVVSISDWPDSRRSFCADTDGGEVLLVARKGRQPLKQAHFITLHRRLDSNLASNVVAEAILQNPPPRDRSVTDGGIGDSDWRGGGWDVFGVAMVRYQLRMGCHRRTGHALGTGDLPPV